MPRAFSGGQGRLAGPRWLAEFGGGFRFGELGILAGGLRVPRYQAASISRDSGREKFIDVSVENDSWLVISESYMPGWRAFAPALGRGRGAGVWRGSAPGAGEFPGYRAAGGRLDRAPHL